MEVGKLVGTPVHLRVECNEGRVGHGLIEMLSPFLAALLLGNGKQIHQGLCLCQIELRHATILPPKRNGAHQGGPVDIKYDSSTS